MKAGNSLNLPSASWKPRKASGIVWRHESQRADGVFFFSLNLKTWEPAAPIAGEDWCPSSSSQSEGEFNLLGLPFVLFMALMDSMMSTLIGEGHLLYSVQQFKCQSLFENTSQWYPEIMFNQLSGHPMAQSSWHIKLRSKIYEKSHMEWVNGRIFFSYMKSYNIVWRWTDRLTHIVKPRATNECVKQGGIASNV